MGCLRSDQKSLSGRQAQYCLARNVLCLYKGNFSTSCSNQESICLGYPELPKMASIVNPARSRFAYVLLGVMLTASAQFAYFLFGSGQTSDPQGDAAHAKPLYTREQFETLIMSKTEDEVLRAVGKPYTTSRGKDVQYWHYANLTLDPLTKKRDSDAQVVFENGNVRAINY
jgi:hypothetical protein